ncbi:putative gustatory receptor 28b [Periplaneta americana]|uniref:putative gustatory receptor 28b n=1 Tax=Periplaneta americana TaxID=6978 RepID=UPI0037E83D48
MSGRLNRTSLHRDIRPLYYVSKVLGLASFSFFKNPETNEESINTKFASNIGGLLWTSVMFCVMIGGLIYSIVRYQLSYIRHAGEVVNNAFSFPLNFVIALVSLLNATVSRGKMRELVNKLIVIEEHLLKYKIEGCCIYSEISIFFLVFGFICYDTWFSGNGLILLHDAIYRLAYLIGFVIVMQFCKFVQMIQHRLITVRNVLNSIDQDTTVKHEHKVINTDDQYGVNRMEFQMSTLTTETKFKNCNGIICAQNNITCVNETSQSEINLKLIEIMHLRRTYNDIYECSGLVNSIYGFQILLLFIRTSIALVTNIHAFIRSFTEPFPEASLVNTGSYLASLPLWIVTFLGMLIAMTVSCQMTSLESKKLNDRVQKALLKNTLTNEMQQQLQLYSSQISSNRIEFTAFWFFTVDLSLLCTILASATTYIVILVQFK